MTTPTPPELPTAQRALSLAFDIVKAPCSAAETQRAEVLLGIATEIRQEQQFRAIDARRAGVERGRAADKPYSYAGETAAWRVDAQPAGLRSGGIIPAPADFAMTRPATVVPADDATAYMPALAERTQSLPIIWGLGDKSDCKHCHTPIEYVEVTIARPNFDTEGLIWRHRYTQQVVCATAPLGGEDEEVVHTFATPSV